MNAQKINNLESLAEAQSEGEGELMQLGVDALAIVGGGEGMICIH